MRRTLLRTVVALALVAAGGCSSSSGPDTGTVDPGVSTDTPADADPDLPGTDVAGTDPGTRDGPAEDAVEPDVPMIDAIDVPPVDPGLPDPGDDAAQDPGVDPAMDPGTPTDTGPDAIKNCGNNRLSSGEQCDDGLANGMPGSACMSDCRKDSDKDGAADDDDCAPKDPARFPGNPEVCNSIDDDCDGQTDDDDPEGVASGRFLDCDGDGIAAVDSSLVKTCAKPVLPKFCPQGTWTDVVPVAGTGTADCDDGDSAVHPGVADTCDGVDNDCDGQTDEDEGGGTVWWYPDCDGDGVPVMGLASVINCGDYPDGKPTGCTAGGSWTSNAPSINPKRYDCNDSDSQVHTVHAEICDLKDNDCDGSTDEGAVALTWYADCDLDTFAAAGAKTVTQCAKPAAGPTGCATGGWTLTPPGVGTTDCNDGAYLAYPGQKGFSQVPMAGRTGIAAWDYDCDGKVTSTADMCGCIDSDACELTTEFMGIYIGGTVLQVKIDKCTAIGDRSIWLKGLTGCWRDWPREDACGLEGGGYHCTLEPAAPPGKPDKSCLLEETENPLVRCR